LHIPDGYTLHWSSSGDAVLTKKDEVFAFAAEIALFLEGFASVRPLIHFSGILEAMSALGLAKTEPDARAGKLKELFAQCDGQVRNVGAFGAMLCENVPAAADPLPLHAIRKMGFANSVYTVVASQGVEQAAWPPGGVDFEVEQHQTRYSLDAIAHWFAHGRAPVGDGAGEQLVEELAATKPPSLAGVLAALTQRQRLAGVVPFVAQLVSALTLPPRRLAQNELPLGGYADVTTRGQPEHLLPSQFALDDLEFVRRFAGGELLYFRREELHAPLREELVVLLDQGVRTWGDVRLVLGAAVFALGQRCVTRKLPLQVAATSNDGRLLDPLAADAEALGQLLEASDLSLHPALALETVLRAPPTAARDIVLLTHPRNLAEPDVAAAARCLQAGSRLFALTVDDAGRAALAELRHGVPVAIAQFRIDWALKARDAVLLPPIVSAAPEGWRGDVEPIPFPFRFGLTSRPTHFAFDQAGDILLIASGNGILHAHHTDGLLTEVLPRGMHDGVVLTDVDAVLGVPDGFVVVGWLGKTAAVAHYSWARRACAIRVIPDADCLRGSWRWRYLPQFNCVVGCADTYPNTRAVDLETGEIGGNPVGKEVISKTRAQRACRAGFDALPVPCAVEYDPRFPDQGIRADRVNVSPESYVVVESDPSPPEWWSLHQFSRLKMSYDRDTGALTVGDSTLGWSRWLPMADGVPILKDACVRTGQYANRVFALLSGKEPHPSPATLRLLRVPEGTPFREWPHKYFGHWGFTLSRDGRQLARQTGETTIAIDDVEMGGNPLSLSPAGRCHNNIYGELGDVWLILGVGSFKHFLCWKQGPLFVRSMSASGAATVIVHQMMGDGRLQYPGSRLEPVNLPPTWERVWYDRKRWLLSAERELVAIVDNFGQVALFSKRQELLCMFFVFRDKLAAWMPDGTRYGPASVTGWSETPDALARIGKVLRDATDRRSP